VEEFQRIRAYGMNTTSRKRLEGEIQESEKKYRELVNYAPAGIYEVDFRTQKFLSVNEAMCLYTGYSREELMAMGSMELLDEPSQQLFRDRIQKWLAGEEPEKNVEFRVLGKDGREIFAELNVTFTIDKQGRPLGATVIAHDISELKRAEQSRRESETKFRTIFESTPFGLALSALPDSVLVDVNDAWLDLFGFQKEEVIGKTTSELGIFLDEEARRRNIAAIQADGKARNIISCPTTRSGEPLVISSNMDLIELGGHRYILGSLENITERERAEQALRWSNQTLQDQAEELEAQARILQGQTEELIQANKRLQESEQRFHLALKNMPIVVATLDRDLRYTWIHNPFGGLTPEDVIGKRIGILTDVESTEKTLISLQEVIRNGTSVHWETTVPIGLGENYFLSYAEPLRNQDGEITGIGIVSINITERKQAEEELAYHASLIDNLHDTVIATDTDQHITAWNKAAEELYGFTSQEALGKSPAILLSEFSDELRASAYQQMAETGRFTVEVVQYTKDGKRLVVEGTTIPRWDSQGKISGYVSAGRDITERKQAEELDKALNRIHRTIHSHLNFQQIMQRSLNEAAKALVCDSAAISLRKGVEWIPTYVYHMPPEILQTKMDDEQEKHAILAIQTKQPVAVEDAFNDERFNREHLRKWRIRSVLVVPILLKNRAIGVIFFNYLKAIHHFDEMHLDFGRQLAASISLALDNTRLIENLRKELGERKKAEYQLEEANAHLERRVQERTAEIENLMFDLKHTATELQNANIELETAQEELVGQNEELEKALETEKSLRHQLIQAEKFAALSRLLASVAHEINNPLQSVKNSLYLLTPEVPPGEPKEMLDVAIHETHRIGALVQQLHETYQQHNHQPVEFNVMETIKKVFTLLGPQMKHNNVQWQVHSEQDCINIQGIPDQIQQVIMNICINAIDAMGPKGGQLTVKVQLPILGRVCISIQDTGPGILECDQARIFEPFFTTKEKGLGLGLPICYEIVKGHGGEITVESEVGIGTTFKVWLPSVT
jgi:PAS domain S-box-containing protein